MEGIRVSGNIPRSPLNNSTNLSKTGKHDMKNVLLATLIVGSILMSVGLLYINVSTQHGLGDLKTEFEDFKNKKPDISSIGTRLVKTGDTTYISLATFESYLKMVYSDADYMTPIETLINIYKSNGTEKLNSEMIRNSVELGNSSYTKYFNDGMLHLANCLDAVNQTY